MNDRPTFFFSHTRQEREVSKFMAKFFRDLGDRVAAFSGSTVPPSLGIIDVQVNQGEDWDSEILAGLSHSRALVAIYTPLFFRRPHCGKELGEFLLRSRRMGLDTEGTLADVENVLPIRWYPEAVYSVNADCGVPRLLHRISYLPAVDPSQENPELEKAVQRYRLRGMERCVDVEPYYQELLDQFALTIVKMQPLPPPTQPVSFATARNVFEFDWKRHFAAQQSSAPESPTAATPPDWATPGATPPTPLTSIVGYYITRRSWVRQDTQVDYAESLIAESTSGEADGVDDALRTVLNDFREAGLRENLTIVSAGLDPTQPAMPATLQANLETLAKRSIPAALVIDAAEWPSTDEQRNEAIAAVMRSSSWTGVILLVSFTGALPNADQLGHAYQLPRPVITLPRDSRERVTALGRVMAEARGQSMRTRGGDSTAIPGAEGLPLLKNVKPSR